MLFWYIPRSIALQLIDNLFAIMASIEQEKQPYQSEQNASDNKIALEEGTSQDVSIDPKEEKKLLARLDVFLVPVIMSVSKCQSDEDSRLTFL